MPFESFVWFSHHGLWAIIQCSTNTCMISTWLFEEFWFWFWFSFSNILGALKKQLFHSCLLDVRLLELTHIQHVLTLMQSWTDQSWILPVAPMALIANSFICVVCTTKTKIIIIIQGYKLLILNWATDFVTFVLWKIMFEWKKITSNVAGQTFK